MPSSTMLVYSSEKATFIGLLKHSKPLLQRVQFQYSSSVHRQLSGQSHRLPTSHLHGQSVLAGRLLSATPYQSSERIHFRETTRNPSAWLRASPTVKSVPNAMAPPDLQAAPGRWCANGVPLEQATATTRTRASRILTGVASPWTPRYAMNRVRSTRRHKTDQQHLLKSKSLA